MNDVASDVPLGRDPAPSADQVVNGIGGAPGIAIGAVYRYHASTPDLDRIHVGPEDVNDEIDLLDEALQDARDELQQVRAVVEDRLDPDSEALLEAQEMMLRDEEMVQAVRQRIRDMHESASRAVRTVLRAYRERLADSDDAHVRERAGDLEELETRLLQGLQRGQAAASIDPNSIVVADRLTAADIIRFSRLGVLGCVSVRGGRTSHVSIIARALGVPAVVGADGILDAVSDHDRVILDGHRGRVIVQPEADTLQRYRRRRAQRQSLTDRQKRLAARPAETTDGHRIPLRANVAFGEALDTLDDYGADGIGLMRTEMLFLGDRADAGMEEDQFAVYREAAERTAEHGATIRLLDLGGDKPLPLAEQEDNPFLGWRGIRVLLDRPESLLRPQIRALLRANVHGTLRVLLPMVTHLDEVRRVRAVVEREADRLAADGLAHDPDLPIGIMVEVPSVALQANAFAEVADFLSIGTNDLTQYVLAVDRGNDRVAHHFDALHPTVLGLVRRTVAAGRAANAPVSLCGEIGSDIHAVPILIGLGLDELSVPPSFLPSVKRVITEIARDDAAALAEAASAAPDADAVRQRARDWINDHLDPDRFPVHETPLDGTERSPNE